MRREFGRPARKIGVVDTIDHSLLRVRDRHAAAVDGVFLKPGKLARSDFDKPDFRALDGPCRYLSLRSHGDRHGLLRGEAMKSGCRPPPDIGWLGGGGGERDRRVLA